jgi:thiosulfate/3-mercaptopyruvate sulfurtransferase
LRIIDANYYKPIDMTKDPYKEYKEEHIPGAIFFPIDDIADKSDNLPHMVPSEDVFIKEMKRLGIRRTDRIVCYDHLGVYASPRVAWTFRMFGADNV